MTFVRLIKCNICKSSAKPTYNGEHWLAPQGWGQIYDDNRAEMLDEHICKECRTGKKTPKKKVSK